MEQEYRAERLSFSKKIHVKLFVQNLDLERKFYEEVLEWPVIKSWHAGGNDRGLMYNAGSFILELMTQKSPIRVQGCALSLMVDDILTLWNKLKNLARVIEPISDSHWGNTGFTISDPEGFELRFYAKTTR